MRFANAQSKFAAAVLPINVFRGMEPKMSWRAYFRIVANFILSMVVAIIVGNILALRLALHPTDAEKAAKLNELTIGDSYTAHPAWWIGVIVLVALMLRDTANGINRTN
jgi:hypothetical protein